MLVLRNAPKGRSEGRRIVSAREPLDSHRPVGRLNTRHRPIIGVCHIFATVFVAAGRSAWRYTNAMTIMTNRSVETPAHPGELMREILSTELGLSADEAAQRMRLPRYVLEPVLWSKAPLTTELARRFAELTGGAPERYLQMQVRYDQWHAGAPAATVLRRREVSGAMRRQAIGASRSSS